MEKKSDKPYVIVRTYSAGVFAGNIADRKGQECILENVRRIWYWDGAASLSELAMNGTSKPETCKFPETVNRLVVTQAIEIIYCTAQAEKSIKGVPVWSKK